MDRDDPPAPVPPRPEDMAIDTTRAHTARVWNYLLGGKDNYPVDRELADQVVHLVPDLAPTARAVRAFLTRVVTHLAGEAGIRQFLDVGTGLPTANNTHEVAQTAAPECRVVYVDNDPLIMAHARALLTSTPEGATEYIHADLRGPEVILRDAGRLLDFDRPIALMLLGILNHVLDDDEAHAVVRRLVDALPSGSYLAISHPTAEVDGDAVRESMRLWNESGATPIKARDRDELIGFFEGMDLLEPGVVPCSLWRPEPAQLGRQTTVYEFGGLARKP